MSGFWDIFKNTNTPEPQNTFGRVPEYEVRALVEGAISKIDWSKAGLCEERRYGRDIYKVAYTCCVSQADRDARKKSMEDITADKVMKEQFDKLEASKRKFDAAIRNLSDMASLMQAALADAGFPEIAKELARRFDETNKRVALRVPSSELLYSTFSHRAATYKTTGK